MLTNQCSKTSSLCYLQLPLEASTVDYSTYTAKPPPSAVFQLNLG